MVSGSASAITVLTGDVTASGPGSSAATLKTVNSAPGVCGDATHFCVPTINLKGLVTGQSPFALPPSFANPMTALGQFIYGGTGGAATTLSSAPYIPGDDYNNVSFLYEAPRGSGTPGVPGWTPASTVFASPPPIGLSAPNSGAFTTLNTSGQITANGGLEVYGHSLLLNNAELAISGALAAAYWGPNGGASLYIQPMALTDTTSSGSQGALPANTILAPSISATNPTTYSSASTLYIGGAPIASTNVTITNPFSVYVNGGATYLGGPLTVVGPAALPATTTVNGTSVCLSTGTNCPATSWASPGAIGSTTPNSGAFTTVAATGDVSAASFAGLPVQEYQTSVKAPLSAWLWALDNCTNQVVNVVYLTDSRGVVFQGDGSSEGPTTATNRYAEQMRIYLQQRCGSHGTGIVPVIKFLFSGSPNPNNQYYSVSGTWSYDSTIGPSQPHSGGGTDGVLISLASGASLTFTTSATGIAYDTLKAYCVTGPSYGTLSISIDSGAHTGTCGGNSTNPTAQLVSVSAGTSLSTHTATITCGTGPCKFYGFEGTNGSTGVSVHNLGEASAVAELYNASTAYAFNDLIANGIHLVITDLGTNEPALGYSTASYTAAMSAIITHEQGLGSSVLVTFPPVDTNNAGTLPAYATALLPTIKSLHAAWVNTQDLWGQSFISSLFGSDGVHPNDKGSLSEYSIQKAAALDVEPTVPSDLAKTDVSNVFVSKQTIRGTSSSTLAGLELDASPNTGASGQDWFIWAQTTSGQNGFVVLSNAFGGLGALAVNVLDATHAKVSTGGLSVFGWNSQTQANNVTTAIDTGMSRVGAGTVAIGNGTAGDTSGTINVGGVLGPATAPSGTCPTSGRWVFSQDGHATFCASGTWTTKI